MSRSHLISVTLGIILVSSGILAFLSDNSLISPFPENSFGSVYVGFNLGDNGPKDPVLTFHVDTVNQIVYTEFRFMYLKNENFTFFLTMPYYVRSLNNTSYKYQNMTWFPPQNIDGVGSVIYGKYDGRRPGETVQMRMEANVEGVASARNRGLYTFFLPLGATMPTKIYDNIQRLKLDVPPRGPGDYAVDAGIGLKPSPQITQTFPIPGQLNLINRTDSKSKWIAWNMKQAQTISVSWIDPDELANSQTRQALSMLFLGVGLPFILTPLLARHSREKITGPPDGAKSSRDDNQLRLFKILRKRRFKMLQLMLTSGALLGGPLTAFLRTPEVILTFSAFVVSSLVLTDIMLFGPVTNKRQLSIYKFFAYITSWTFAGLFAVVTSTGLPNTYWIGFFIVIAIYFVVGLFLGGSLTRVPKQL